MTVSQSREQALSTSATADQRLDRYMHQSLRASSAQDHSLPEEQSLPPPLLAALTCTQGTIAGAAAHALGALLRWCTQGGDAQDVLARAGLQPHRLRKNRELLEALTASSTGGGQGQG